MPVERAINVGLTPFHQGTTGSVLFIGASEVVQQDNTNFFWDNTNNYLGLGTATPSARLHIVQASSSTNSLFIKAASNSPTGAHIVVHRFSDSTELFKVGYSSGMGIATLYHAGHAAIGGTAVVSNVLLSVSANIIDPTQNTQGVNLSRTLVLTASNTRDIYGGQFNISTSANSFNHTGTLNGGYFSVGNSNLATVTSGSGGYFQIYNVGTGTLTSGYGGRFTTRNLVSGGTITNSYGGYYDIEFNNGTIANTYGFYVGDITKGTQTNTPFSFYASDAGSYNYFAGRVGIGVTAPTASLSFATGAVIDFNAGDVTITHAANSLTISGGTFNADGGGALTGTWSDLGSVTTVDINGGTIDGVTIGASVPGTIVGTTITVNTNLVPDINDGAGLGISGTAFSDLFLASGAVINFNAADIAVTHSSNALTLTGGQFFQKGTSLTEASFSQERYTADTFAANQFFRKSRNAVVDGHTVVQDGDALGLSRFYGSDGSAFVEGAQFGAVVDGTPAAGSVPAELQFSTRPAGGSVSIRMRVKSSGNVALGSDRDDAKLAVDQSSITGGVPVLLLDQADTSEEFIRFIGRSASDNSESLIDSTNLPTPGSVVGWLRIYVEDINATSPITDGIYFVPFYSTPTV